MQIDTGTAGAWLALAAQHRTITLLAGGLAVVLLLVAARLARTQKRRSAALTFAASTIALGFSAEGMWEVATGALHLTRWQAVLLFAFAEVLMLFEADQARRKIAEKKDPSRHLRAVWVIALVAALAAASHADNVSGQVVRFFMPMAVAWQWASRIKDDLPDVAKQESRWIWTPQRVGVRLGLLKPGTVDDLGEVFRQRRIAALVSAGVALYAERQAAKLRGDQPAERRWWQRDRLAVATRRVQQLAMTASREDVAAARTQLRLTFGIEGALLGEDEQPSESERELMDELRRVMSAATTKLRADHARAFGLDQPRAARPDQIWSNGLVQMPAQLAAQIPPRRADQTPAADRTNPTDQIRTIPSGPDQAVTNASVPASKPATVRQTTVRVDRAKPISPAAGGDVPPKVREMAKALAKKYRGEIPSRKDVMAAMGWTSADYAGKAIKLVREERASKSNQ